MKKRTLLSTEEFKWQFRDCYGELSVPEIMENAPLIEFINELEKKVFPNCWVKILFRPVLARFRALVSVPERRSNIPFLLKLNRLEERVDGGSPPSSPATRLHPRAPEEDCPASFGALLPKEWSRTFNQS